MSSASRVVGARLREARTSAGLSQEAVALGAGTPVSYYGKLERGQTNPTLDSLVRVCGVLNVSLSAVVDGVGEDPRPPDQG